MLTRTLTPERWLTSGDRRASCVSSAISSSMKRGSSSGGTPVAGERRSLLEHDLDLVVDRARVVRAHLRAEAVLERRDDPAAAGVVLRVGARHDEQVQRQAQRVAAHLDVTLLEHVEQPDLDALGEVGQLVDGEDASVGARHEAVVDGRGVGEVAALGDLDRIDLADQVGDGDVGRGQLLGVAPVARQPLNGRLIALGVDQLARDRTDRRERVVVELATGDDRDELVEQTDQQPRQPRLGLAALTEETHVLAGQDRVLDRRDDAFVVTDDAREDGLLGGQLAQQVGAQLLFDGAALVALCAQLAERLGRASTSPRSLRVAGREGIVGVSLAYLRVELPLRSTRRAPRARCGGAAQRRRRHGPQPGRSTGLSCGGVRGRIRGSRSALASRAHR